MHLLIFVSHLMILGFCLGSSINEDEDIEIPSGYPEPVIIRLTSLKSGVRSITEFNVSREFIDFLNEEPEIILSKGYNSGEGCFRRCRDVLRYLQRLQQYYNSDSLFPVYYYLSTSRDCFCYDNGHYSYGQGGLFGGNGNFNSEIEVTIDIEVDIDSIAGAGPSGSGGQFGGGGWPNKKQNFSPNNGRSCQNRNLFYWLIKVIQSGEYSLRRPGSLDRVCGNYICGDY